MSRVLFNPSAALFLPGQSQSLSSRSLSVRGSLGRVLKASELLVKLMPVGQESVQCEVHFAGWFPLPAPFGLKVGNFPKGVND